jgi:hypothetical protein
MVNLADLRPKVVTGESAIEYVTDMANLDAMLCQIEQA